MPRRYGLRPSRKLSFRFLLNIGFFRSPLRRLNVSSSVQRFQMNWNTNRMDANRAVFLADYPRTKGTADAIKMFERSVPSDDQDRTNRPSRVHQESIKSAIRDNNETPPLHSVRPVGEVGFPPICFSGLSRSVA